MQREMQMCDLPSPASDNVTPVVVVPIESDFDSIPGKTRNIGLQTTR